MTKKRMIEVRPERDDLVKLLTEKLGMDPETVIVGTEDGMITREGKALVFGVDLDDSELELLDRFCLTSDNLDIDGHLRRAFRFLLDNGIINDDLVSTCGMQPVAYCEQEFGIYSYAWYCAQIVTKALNADYYGAKAQAGEIPVTSATFHAVQLGAWCVEFNLKFKHEENAMRGAKMPESGLLGAEHTRSHTHKGDSQVGHSVIHFF